MNGKLWIILSVIFFSIIGSSASLAKKPIFTEEFNIELVACEGLELDGVTYSFTVAGVPDINCNAGSGCPTTNNILPPCVQYGTPGVLHLRFDRPTTVFGFGVAQLSFETNVQSVIVDLFRPGSGMLREEVFLDTSVAPTFSGARYDYQGPAVRSVSIRISEEFSFPVAIDNITYFRSPGHKL